MKKMTLFTALAFMCLSLSIGPAADKIDFSGEWILDADRSDPAPRMIMPAAQGHVVGVEPRFVPWKPMGAHYTGDYPYPLGGERSPSTLGAPLGLPRAMPSGYAISPEEEARILDQ